MEQMSIHPEIFKRLSTRAACQIEATTGLRHSRVGSVATLARKFYGLPKNTSVDDVIEHIEKDLAEMGFPVQHPWKQRAKRETT